MTTVKMLDTVVVEVVVVVVVVVVLHMHIPPTRRIIT